MALVSFAVASLFTVSAYDIIVKKEYTQSASGAGFSTCSGTESQRSFNIVGYCQTNSLGSQYKYTCSSSQATLNVGCSTATSQLNYNLDQCTGDGTAPYTMYYTYTKQSSSDNYLIEIYPHSGGVINYPSAFCVFVHTTNPIRATKYTRSSATNFTYQEWSGLHNCSGSPTLTVHGSAGAQAGGYWSSQWANVSMPTATGVCTTTATTTTTVVASASTGVTSTTSAGVTSTSLVPTLIMAMLWFSNKASLG